MGDLSVHFSRSEFACDILNSGLIKSEWPMSGKVFKVCPSCNDEFWTYKSVNKECCSNKCKFELQKLKTYEKYKQVCEVCEKEFLPPRPAEGARFCSYACSGVSMRKERVCRQGYWAICVPSHPNATKQGYVFEHRLIMEKHIGRQLEAGEVVHHIDHNRKNNAIENLQLMTDSEHKNHHARAAGKACKGVERGGLIG